MPKPSVTFGWNRVSTVFGRVRYCALECSCLLIAFCCLQMLLPNRPKCSPFPEIIIREKDWLYKSVCWKSYIISKRVVKECWSYEKSSQFQVGVFTTPYLGRRRLRYCGVCIYKELCIILSRLCSFCWMIGVFLAAIPLWCDSDTTLLASFNIDVRIFFLIREYIIHNIFYELE